MSWKQAQKWEKGWWGNCTNTLGEEEKQLIYAKKMGLKTFHDGKSPYNFDMKGKTVLDIGGGPCSLLLKCCNVKGKVIDPCKYPQWVSDRYKTAGIEYERRKGEDLDLTKYYDLTIGYNLLQHTDNPTKIISNILKVSKIVKWFDWIDTGISRGHPYNLTEKLLNKWFKGKGKVEELKGQSTCRGKCWYGTFLGELYDKKMSNL